MRWAPSVKQPEPLVLPLYLINIKFFADCGACGYVFGCLEQRTLSISRISGPITDRLFGERQLLEADGAGDTGAVGRIGTAAIGDVALLDVQARIAHRAGRVVEECLLLGECHQAEEIARLLPVVVVDAVVPVRRLALQRQWRLGEIGLIVPEPGAVGIEAERAAQIAVRAHLPVAM